LNKGVENRKEKLDKREEKSTPKKRENISVQSSRKKEETSWKLYDSLSREGALFKKKRQYSLFWGGRDSSKREGKGCHRRSTGQGPKGGEGKYLK